jgi:hypothetical protein
MGTLSQQAPLADKLSDWLLVDPPKFSEDSHLLTRWFAKPIGDGRIERRSTHATHATDADHSDTRL